MSIFIRNITNHILIAALLVLIGCSGPGMDEQQMLQNAKTYLDKRDLMAASIELRNTLKENPEHAEARFLLAGINLETGDFAGAEKEYRRAAKAGWKAEEVQIGMARVYLAQYQFRKLLDEIQLKDSWSPSSRADLLGLRAAAEASLGELSQADTTLANGRSLKAEAFHILKTTAIFQLSTGQTQQAVATLQQALSIYQDNSELLLLYATAYMQEKNFSKAAENYRNIIDQGPTTVITTSNRQARIGLARLAIIEKDYVEARTTLAPLIKGNENDPDANYLAGLIAYERGDYSLAQTHVRKLVEIAPNHGPSKLLMGKIEYALEHYDQAAQYLSGYLSTSPDDIIVIKLLASTYIALGQDELASSTLQPALLKNPNDAGLLSLMSQLEITKGDTEAGIRELEKSIETAPDNAGLRMQLAEAYMMTGETEKAIEELKSFKKLSKQSEEADNLMIVAYVRAGQLEQAINTAQEMLAEKPLDTGMLALNGSLYATSGNNQQAREYFEKALQIDPDFATAAIGLARIESFEGNMNKAVEIYESLANSGKGGSAPMLALADIAKHQDRTEDMLGWLEKAREAAPNEIGPRISLANHYLHSKQPEKADLVVREAIKIAPENTLLLELQGKILIAQKRHNEALSTLKILVEKEPDSAYARVLLAESYMRLGITGNAREHLNNALELQPEHVLALGLMAEVELQAGAANKSLSYAERLQQTQPELNLGYQLEGDAWMSMKNYSNARAAFLIAWQKQQTSDLAIKLFDTTKRSGSHDEAIAPLLSWLNDHPEDYKTRMFLAGAYQEWNKIDDAVREYEKILQEAPGNVSAMNNLAWLYSLKDNPKALQLAQRAYVATNGNDPYIRDTYGWILVQQGQHEKGKGILKQAVSQSPDNLEIQYHYAIALQKSGKEDECMQILGKLLDEGKPFSGRDEAERLLAEYNATR